MLENQLLKLYDNDDFRSFGSHFFTTPIAATRQI